MRLDRWAVMHGRPDQPGYRFVCSTHWTKLGAAQQARGMDAAARQAGYTHTYWVARVMGEDKPGDYYLVAPPVTL